MYFMDSLLHVVNMEKEYSNTTNHEESNKNKFDFPACKAVQQDHFDRRLPDTHMSLQEV